MWFCSSVPFHSNQIQAKVIILVATSLLLDAALKSPGRFLSNANITVLMPNTAPSCTISTVTS